MNYEDLTYKVVWNGKQATEDVGDKFEFEFSPFKEGFSEEEWNEMGTLEKDCIIEEEVKEEFYSKYWFSFQYKENENV
jgi:hypothetical protein